MLRILAAALLIAGSSAIALADPGPTLLTVFPPGVKAGETVEVVFTGTNFDGDEKLLFSDSRIKGELVSGSSPAPKMPNPQPGQKATTVKFKVTAPKDSRTGTYDVRLVSKGGLTNPRAFVVSGMKEENESEPNSETSQANKVEVNSTVNGAIATNTDVDYFSVPVKAGQNIVVYCLTTSIDSKMSAELMVIAPDGKPIASNHSYRDGDAVLDFKAPTDGDYLVRVSQFAYTTGGVDHFYRLTISTGPWHDAAWPPVTQSNDRVVLYGRNGLNSTKSEAFTRPDGRPFDTTTLVFADKEYPKELTGFLSPHSGMVDSIESPRPGGNLRLTTNQTTVLDNEKNHRADTAQAITLPCDVAGRIEKKGARHWYSFNAKKGEVWTIEVFADRIGSPVDAFFQLTDAKGKMIVEQDDGPDPLSPNQFYTRTDDPARYRFNVPADDAYRVMVSTREAAVHFGVRDQYVLRIAKEKPDFRLAVMPVGSHYLDAGTMAKGGSAVFHIYAWRFDGFDAPIELSGVELPKGVTCPHQVLGPGQVRGTLVLSADKDAADWAGFVTIQGTATVDGQKLTSTARPFSIVWPFPGITSGQPAPNSPMITRMDRGAGLAVAVRGAAPFSLVANAKEPIKVISGKAEVTLKVIRSKEFKDGIQIYSASPGFGPRQQGGQPPPPIGGIAADKDEVKLVVDLPPNLPSGVHTLVLRGVAGAPAGKGGNQQRLSVSYPSQPIAIEMEGKGTPKKK